MDARMTEAEAGEQEPRPAGATSLQVDPVVLEQFWNLASLEASQRQEAASTLLQRLQLSQRAHSEKLLQQHGGAGSDGEEKKKKKKTSPAAAASVVLTELEGNGLSPELRYAVKRLVRGLGSAREGARLGFALALTMLLGATTSEAT